MAKKGNLAAEGADLIKFVLSITVGLVIAVYIVFELANSLTGDAANVANGILTALSGTVVTVIEAVIVIAAVILLYSVAKQKGLV